MKLILTHSNADFDAVAATMAAHKLYPDAIPVLPDRLNRNVQHFMMLYRNGLNFVNEGDLTAKGVQQVILVDTQRLPKIKGVRANIPQIVIDHHHPYKTGTNFISEKIGAVTTLMVERLQQEAIPINPLEATLMALGIYEDTGSLSYGTTTSRDIQAAAWLLEQNAVLDTVRRFLSPPLSNEQRVLLEMLLASTENRLIQGQSITVCTAQVDHYIEQIASVAHQLRDMLESSAIFIAVAMPDNLLLVGRSTDDVLDVGKIARIFGGGGHARAAAATIYDKTLEEVKQQLWKQIETRVQPVTRVENLMSYGVQTVEADQQIRDMVQHLRRIGHEGFPVVSDKEIVGLLTRREVDRAIEHGLGDMTVRDIMTVGDITLNTQDSVQTLEQKMVESGWGQIPVLDEHNQLIGIVTRTDLIKHWANTHPMHPPEKHLFSLERIEEILGTPVAKLIRLTTDHAQDKHLNLYLVGGCVRDLLLQRPNYDIDFVVEQSAIEFANNLYSSLGGDIHSYQPFGTAKWIITEDLAQKLEIDHSQLPAHIDFATARNEFYEHPTALPTVYRSSIKLDLQRRDFTINTLAIQLSPETAQGHVLDFYGGKADLQAGLVRVLHTLSFVDDPTRILRAMRFKRRLNFTIEARTAELMRTALPMLRRITGERIRNELNLLLREDEPEQALLELQSLGILEAIHPALALPESIAEQFEVVRTDKAPWQNAIEPDLLTLYWHTLASQIPPDNLEDLCERLQLGKRFSQSLIDTAHLCHKQGNIWNNPNLHPSQVVEILEKRSEAARLTAWLIGCSPGIRDYISQYEQTWRYIQPALTGDTLHTLGIKPGPCYQVILTRLRYARLNQDVHDAAGEQQLVRQWLSEGICDDPV